MTTSQETLVNRSSTPSPLAINNLSRRVSRERHGQLAPSRAQSSRSSAHHSEVEEVNDTQPDQSYWTGQEAVQIEAPRWVIVFLRFTGRLFEKIPGVRVKFHSGRRE